MPVITLGDSMLSGPLAYWFLRLMVAVAASVALIKVLPAPAGILASSIPLGWIVGLFAAAYFSPHEVRPVPIWLSTVIGIGATVLGDIVLYFPLRFVAGERVAATFAEIGPFILASVACRYLEIKPVSGRVRLRIGRLTLG